ncbi:MAG: hypothetical protein AAFR32_08510 [Pseudomonadota bacterium]
MMKRALLIGVAPVVLALPGCIGLSSDQDVASAVAEDLPALPDTWVVDGAPAGEVRIGWIEAVGDLRFEDKLGQQSRYPRRRRQSGRGARFGPAGACAAAPSD